MLLEHAYQRLPNKLQIPNEERRVNRMKFKNVRRLMSNERFYYKNRKTF